MKILVTGADGFVGRVLCRRLLAAGYSPRAGVVSARWHAPRDAADVAILGDIGAAIPDRRVVAGAQAVIHLAARVHHFEDRAGNALRAYRRVNVLGTERLAHLAVSEGVRRFVFVSSVKVNGESTAGEPFTEDDPACPEDPYAISKWEAEQALRRISDVTGLELVIVRPPLVYGPGVRANFLRLLHAVHRGLPIPLPNIHNRRSLLGVENLADFLVQCAVHPAAARELFLVSDGEDVSTRDLIVRLGRRLERVVRFLPVPAAVLRASACLFHKEKEIARLLGSLAINPNKARQKLGWKPPLSFDEGLTATCRWYLDAKRASSDSRIDAHRVESTNHG